MARRTFDEIMQDRTTTRRKSFDDVLNSRRKSFDEIVPRRESVNTLEQMQDPAAVNAVEMIQKKSIEEKTKDDYNNLPEGAFEFVEANKKNNKISSLVDVASRNNNKFSILNKAASTTKSNISELLQTEYGMDKKRADYYENNWENISANKKSADFQKEMDDAISKMDSKQYELLKDYAQTSAIGFISPNGSSIAQKEMLQDRKNAKNRLMSEYGLTEEELAKLSDYVKRDSNKKYTEKLDEEAKEISKTGFGRGVLRAESLILSPVSGLSATIDNATQKITGRPVDIYSEGNLLHNMKTSAQSAVSESVGEKYGDKAQFINDVLMSTAESAETMLIGSGVASGLGLGGSIAEVAAKIASYPLFSSNAFASSFKEKKESGQNDDQAFAYAMASGIAEGLFEELSFDRLQGILRSTGKVGVKEFIKNMLKQGLFEGTEEINTSIANTISDYLINADYSDYSMNKEAYMQNGYEEEEAGKMANKDLAKQLLYDGMAGAISGILMGGGASVVNYHNYKNMGSSASNETLKKATDTALASDIAKESTAREIAQKMSEEGRDVDSLTSKEKTQLFESLGSLQKEEINQAITDSLSSRVENADTMDKARALFREYYESDMTDEQFEQKLVNEVAKNSSERNAIQEAKKEVFGRESKVTPITQSLHNAGRDLQLDIHNKAIEKQIAKQDKQAQKNFAKFENAVSSKEKYSKAKGVAAVSVKNGKETTDTKVLGIQRLGGENASVVVEGGKTVALKDVTFADQNFGKLYNEVSSVISSVEVANKALENYKGQPVESYVKAYNIAYELGRQSVRTNKNADWLLNNALDSYIIQNMGGAGVASEIFYNGQNDARKLASMKPKSENKSFKNKSNGEEILKGESEIKHLLAAISEKTGVKISEINAIKDNEGNYNTALLGSFFDNVIALNSDGKNEIQTLLHEVMEKMKSENQEGYNLIVSHVMDYVQSTNGSEALIDNLQKYQRAYAAVEGYSATEEIADEYTNDFVSGILTSKEGLQDLASWASNQNTNTAKNLFEAIKDFFSRILDEITRYMDSHKASMNPGTRDGFESTGKKIEELRQVVLNELDKMGNDNLHQSSSKIEEKKLSINVNEDSMYYVEEDGTTVISEKQFSKNKLGRANYKNNFQKIINIALLSINGETYVIKSDNRNVIADVVFADEFSGSIQTFSAQDRERAAKMNSIAGLSSIIENAKNPTYKKNLKAKHNKNAKRGWVYYDIRFGIKEENINYFTAKLVVRLDENGNDYLYDIINIKKEASNPSHTTNSTSGVKTASLKDIISEKEKNATQGKHNKKSFSVDVNSDGEKLTPEQVEYFKDSVVRDESGKLMVMYHGTPNATFTVFRPNSFFTGDKSYADVYQNVGASSDSVKITADNPDTYKVYLNIKKPFDTRNPEVKKIWDEQYYHKWDTGELMESGLPDWNAASGLIDFIEENELDFDGLILDEGGVGGYGDEVKSRGLSYVVFHPSQVKNVTNENPTDNSDIRYSVDIDDELSIDVPVEEKNDLIAIHNISEEKLLNLLELEGIPMPSVAITKDTIGWDSFGEISFVFGKESIDPQNEKNKVYDTDIYSPVFPEINIILDNDKVNYLHSLLRKSIENNSPQYFIRQAELAISGLESEIARYGIDKTIKHMKNNTGIQMLYLKSKGIDTPILYSALTDKMENSDNSFYKWIIENYDLERINKMSIKELIDSGIAESIISQYNSRYYTELTNDRIFSIITKASEYMEYMKSGYKEVESFEMERLFIDYNLDDNYDSWLSDTFNDIVKGKSIVKEKSSDKNDFEKIYLEYTAENVLKTMLDNVNLKNRFTNKLTDINQLKVGTSKEFKSIDEIKKASSKITKYDSKKYSQLNKRFVSVMKNIYPRWYDSSDPFFEIQSGELGIAILEASNNPTKENIFKILNSRGWKTSIEQASEISYIINEISNLPVEYFEAKLARVVGFEEGIIVIPDTASKKLKEALKKKGLSYIEYNKELNNRKEVINSHLFDRKFQVDIDDELSIFASVMEENEQLKEASNVIKNTVQNIANLKIKSSDIRKIASDIKNEYKINTSVEDIAEALANVFNYMQQDNVNYDALVQIMGEIAKPMLENATTTTSTRSEAWDAFRIYLSGTRFKLSNKQAREVISAYGSTENYRKALFGVVTVSKDAEMTLDEMWSELVDASGNTLPAYVSDTDQPAVLLETINGLRPQSEKTNTYGMNLESASYDLALDIYRRFFEAQARQNMNAEINKAVGLVKAKQLEYRRKSLEQYKEKLAQQKILLEAEKKKNIKALAEEIKNADVDLQQALSENNDVAAAIIEDLKNKNAKKIEQIKKQKDKDIAEIKARNFDARKNERDRRKNAALKEQLKNQTNALNKMLKSPNTANFVKPSLVKGTIDVLESINLDTGKSQGMRDKLARLSEMYAAYKSDSTFNFDYDENTHAMILELRDTFKDRNYTELSNDELKRVVELVIRLKTQIQNASKLLRNEQYSDAAKCATAVIGEVNDSKGSLDNAFTKKLDNYLSYQLNAYRWFRKTSGYKDDGALMNIYNQLDRGQLDMIRMQKEINDMFAPLLFGKENQENIKRLSSIEDKDMVDIGMKVDGKPVKVTRGMLLSYLMHVQNEGNARHMVLGGFTVPDMKAYKDGKYSTAYEKTVIGQFFTLDDIKQATENIKYSKKDAGLDDGVKVAVKLLQGRAKKLRNNLSEWELSYLETAEKLFHEYYGQKINEVSVETKGYALAQVKNYYPIRTDKKFTRTEFAALKQDGSLEGMGFLKERIKASNPIMLEDITQVILRQTDNTSRYVGFSIPVRNVNMVMNMKFNNKTSPESAISSKWGEQNLKLFQKIMQDIQTGRGVDEGLGKVFTALRGNFAAATLTANVGVGMKQAASYPTAAAVLGWKPLAKAFKDIPKGVTSKGIPELEAINPLLWYRSQGQSSADINYAKQSDVYKFLDNKAPALKAVSVDLIQNIDSATVRTLEYASMYYVDEQYKDLQKGTEEYWSKVSDVFTKVVEETQPNYTVLQRPEVLKDTNALVRQLFMFKTQPMQNLGILYDAIGEFSTVKKKYNKSSAEYKASADKVARAVSSQLVAALVFSAMTILSNVIYHKLWKYDQDEDKSFVEEALVALMDGVAGTLSGMLICGDWIYNATKELLFGAKNYGVEVSIVENFNNTVSMINKYKEYSVKLAEAKTEAQRADAITKLLRNTEDLAVSIGQYFGIPVNNLKNTLTAPYLYIKDIATGNQLGSSNLFWDETPESQKMRMYEALIDGNMERYQKLFDEQVQASDATDPEQSIHNQIKNMLHDAYLEKEIGPEQVLKYLDDAGIEYKDDILDEWDYKYETGATSYSKYSRMNDAIGLVMQNDTSDNRKAMTEEIKKLVSDGVDKGKIGSNLTSKYKQQYLELKKQGNAASMKNILVTCYMAAGYTREEATKRIDNWK